MSHLTLSQRYQIESQLSQGISPASIGRCINKDRSVICREIARNSDARNGNYKAELAHSKYQDRQRRKKKNIRFTPEIKEYVLEKLAQDFSPEQIAGRAKVDKIQCVSHERIYQFVWKDKKSGGMLFKHLRNQGKKYRKRGHSKDTRGLIAGRVDIGQRPKVVEYKERIGDLEIDLIIGKNHNEAILTINDRAAGLLFMGKVPNKQAISIQKKALELLADYGPLLHTITSDNGKEFGNHKQIADQLNIDFYFARPYHSWQRGANENLNGLVRQYFAKDCDFTTITETQIHKVQNKLNNRPRKRFGYKTPIEIFALKLNQQARVAFVT